jgi:hypothetical protein
VLRCGKENATGKTSKPPPATPEKPVLTKCANPDCLTPFKYLREGKLIRMFTGVPSARQKAAGHILQAASRRSEFFWLCNACSARFTLVFDEILGVHLLPLRLRREPVSEKLLQPNRAAS